MEYFLLHVWKSLYLPEVCDLQFLSALKNMSFLTIEYLDGLVCSFYHFLQTDIQPPKAESMPVPCQLSGSTVWQLATLRLLHVLYVSKADKCQQLEPAQTVEPRPKTWLMAGIKAV